MTHRASGEFVIVLAREFGILLWSLALMGAPASVLRGVVTDSSGALVPGVKIVLTAQDGTSQTAVTDNKGGYSFSGISPGDYTVQASAPQLVLTEPVQVTLSSATQTLNLQLSVAPVAQRVEVDTDAPPTVGTAPESNSTALVVHGSDLEALSDDPEDLLTDLQALAGPSAGPSGGSLYIDGFSSGDLPPKESIREVRINQNPFSPEYDKLGLGRIEVITKPGSARFHGNLNYNLGSAVWNSRNPYSAGKAPFLLNEFENTISGPINRHASFSLIANQNDVDNGSIVNAVTLDPSTFFSSPFFAAFKTIQRRTRFFPRIDYQLNEKNTLSVRYGFTHGDIQGAGIGGFDLVSRGYHTRYTTQTVQLIETTTLGAAGVNESRFQFYRNASQILPTSSATEIHVQGSFNGGGAAAGNSQDTQNNFEFQNSTTFTRGSHTWRFGARARVQTDDNVSPMNFNGTFTFGGGVAPALDSSNNPVLGPSGQPVLTQISSIESYRRTLLFDKLGMTPNRTRALAGY